MHVHRLLRVVPSTEFTAFGLTFLSSSNCYAKLAQPRIEIRLFSRAIKGPAHPSAGSVPQLSKYSKRGKHAMTTDQRVYLEKQRQVGFPHLKKAREASKRAGYPAWKRHMEAQRKAGFPQLTIAREASKRNPAWKKYMEAQRKAGFPQLKKAREAGDPGLKKYIQNQRKIDFPPLQRGHETQRKHDFPALARGRAKRMAKADARRVSRGLRPKKRLQIPCPKCSKIYQSDENLQRHDAIAHKGLRYRCPFAGCNKNYSGAHGIKKHLRGIHSREALVRFMPDYDPSTGEYTTPGMPAVSILIADGKSAT